MQHRTPSLSRVIHTVFIALALIAYHEQSRASRTMRPRQQLPGEPNILFIMSDDHTANAIGCFGSRFAPLNPTPNIDRLAAQGMILKNVFCTNSICAPSRASIFTGLYSHKNGVRHLTDQIDPEAPNLARLLGTSGYNTAIVGKWHLKVEPPGFDHWMVLPGQGRYKNPEFRTPDGMKTIEGHSTDVITDLAIDWLKNGREADKPFFLMCHFKATHESWQYADRYADLYEDVEFPEPPSLFEDQSHRSQATRNLGYTMETLAPRMAKKGHVPEQFIIDPSLSAEDQRSATYQHFMKAYFRTVRGIDDNVGRLTEFLHENGLDDNTLVVYTSDQGYFLGEHNYIDKRWMFEESLRMPMVVRYPAEVKPGSTCESLIINTDFAPMMLDYAGMDTPDWMQGRSFRPILQGNVPDGWARRILLSLLDTPERATFALRCPHRSVQADPFLWK